MNTAAARHGLFPVKNFLTLLAVAFSLVFVLPGCQTAPARASSSGRMAPTTRNNCYSLLHQLLDDQKDVSVLRFIKREHSDVKELVKKIASASGAGAKLLEEFAKKDPMVNLDATLSAR
jgi:hypothetical protein